MRLCKGAYLEPEAVAIQDKAEVDRNFLKLARKLLTEGNYPGIATHDEAIINEVIRFVKEQNIASERFEFQMLYGIRRDLQTKILRDGYRMRIYVPFGEAWYPYFMRRLAERPANVLFLARNVFVADVNKSGNLAARARVKQFVRYWGFLLAKFAASSAILGSLVWIVNWLWAGHANPVVIRHHAVRDETYLAYLVCMFTRLPDRRRAVLSQHSGSSLSVPRMSPPIANAHRNRLLEQDAAVWPPAHSIHLYLRSWQTEYPGTAPNRDGRS